MSYKVVLISSGQPSLNPRLVKEADALAAAGYEVTVLYAYWNDWGTRFDRSLLATKKWRAICVGGDPQNDRSTYLASWLLHKAARMINRRSGGRRLAELAIARSSYFLIREAKKYDADLYIGHNSGALPATVRAAKANNRPCGFDAEDFHRFEVSSDPGNPDTRLKTQIEDRYIPQTDYLSAASPLIGLAYRDLFPGKKVTIIHNVFPVDTRVEIPQRNHEGPVRLFWFSQTIGPNRGLENIVEALRLLKGHPFELHLLGHRQTDIFQDEQDLPIRFHDPVPPGEIALLASQFDIGLAAENSTPLNRDICLTNKIFMYMQAGLAIAASDTTAQVKLLSEYPGIGRVYQQQDPASLAGILLDYAGDRQKLLTARRASRELALRQMNWESEQGRFLTLVADFLKAP